MKNHVGMLLGGWRRALLATAGIATLVVPIMVGALTVPRLRAQASAGQSPARQVPANQSDQSIVIQSPATPAPAGQAQVGGAERPAFEVASVKTNKGDGNRIMIGGLQPGGRYTSTNVTLEMLITAAYQLKPHQMAGEPDWIKSDRFDIEAKAEGNPTRDQINLMLQSLLADRFKMAVHHETQQHPIYALVVSKAGKTGAQLQPHTDDSKCPGFVTGPPAPPPGSAAGMPPAPQAPCGGFMMAGSPIGFRMAGQKITMEILTRTLGNFVDRVVVDRTGLSGVFDVSLDFSPQQTPAGFAPGPGADAGASDPSAPVSIFTAVQEQLGLKLEPQTGPLDVLVIDHVERPSEN